MKSLLERFSEYKENKFREREELLDSLKNGQSPGIFLITCSDSRISVNEFTNSSPGEVFVIRNAGNVISEYDPDNPTSESITLEYGVVALNIGEIVICGHRDCGAMKGVQNVDQLNNLPLVQKTLKKLGEAPLLRGAKDRSLEDVIGSNVKQQCQNLMTYPFIRERVISNDLKVIGCVYDFAKGELDKVISGADLISS